MYLNIMFWIDRKIVLLALIILLSWSSISADSHTERNKTKEAKSLVPKRDWLKTINEVSNKFRILHGVKPLELNDTLNKDAQEMAEKNARECNINHSDLDMREKNTGSWTGENLCWKQSDEAIDDVAERCANAWYEEEKFYPFPKGWVHAPDGSADALLKQFGHFTQLVWKESRHVGYGLVSTRNCTKNGRLEHYVAARYYRGGNRRCCFVGNVLSRKNNSSVSN